MVVKLGRVGGLASLCMLSVATGCATLSTDPLSPPHVRRASCATEHRLARMESKMSPEYQEWLDEVRHFGHDTWNEFCAEYYRNEYWPRPYSDLAAQSWREPQILQAENARLQMLSIWDYHFEPDTGRLNAMGKQRLQNIVDQADALGRTIYVRRTQNPQQTQLRVVAVREQLDKLSDTQGLFDVVEANASPSGVSGDEAQRAVDLLTAPPGTRIPASTSSYGGGSSGGQSSGGGSGSAR